MLPEGSRKEDGVDLRPDESSSGSGEGGTERGGERMCNGAQRAPERGANVEVLQRGFRGHSDRDSQGKVVKFKRGFSGLGVGLGQSGVITALRCAPGLAPAP